MVKKIIHKYYNFFDKRLENGTIIVLIIALLVAIVGSFATSNKATFEEKVSINSHESQK